MRGIVRTFSSILPLLLLCPLFPLSDRRSLHGLFGVPCGAAQYAIPSEDAVSLIGQHAQHQGIIQFVNVQRFMSTKC